MSSLAPAPSGAAPETPRPARAARRVPVPRSQDLLAGLALAAALSLLTFVTTGGTTLAPNTGAEIVLVLIGAGAVLAVARRPVARGWNGVPTVLAFAAFSALTALSIAWSVAPDESWLEANRMIAYLAALGAAVALVRLYGDRWRAVVGGIGGFCVAMTLWALLSKTFPAAIDPNTLFGRLQAPFAYWNAVGLVAAMGLPPLVWAGARPDGGPWSRALAVPGIGILLTALVLSYSRSAVLAAICGLALWFTFVPLRLRGAAALFLGALAAAAPTAFALHTRALTHDRIPLGPRVDAGDAFGLVLALALIAATAIGFAGAYAADRADLAPAIRRRIGTGLIVALALVPVAVLGAAAASSRGLTGEISHAWHSLTDVNGGAANTPGRLVALGNSRALYWSEGLSVGEHHPLAGAGAGTYPTARTRYATHVGIVTHAHSFEVETFAELGALGLLVSLGLLVVWGREALRTVGRRAVGLEPAERVGLLTLAAVVVCFGVHSSVDWTWEIPGTAIPALLCAGWLAGRSRRAPAAPGRRARPAVVPALAALLVVALLAAWAIWQPLRAVQAVSAAENALVAGNGAQALTDARTAAARNPLSPQPLWTEADILTARGDVTGARSALLRAVDLQPENASTWRALGFFELSRHEYRAALASLVRSHQFDPTSASTDAGLKQGEIALSRGAK